jgi:hypothetical protein
MPRAQELLERSLMLVTALVTHIGYDRAAAIAKHAHRHGLGLREAAIAAGGIRAEDFDAWVDPGAMLGPGVTVTARAEPAAARHGRTTRHGRVAPRRRLDRLRGQARRSAKRAARSSPTGSGCFR